MMILLPKIHPVTDFSRNAKQYAKRLKKTGNPEVLTIDGEAEIVIQSPAAYQKLLDAAELAETLPILRKSLEEAKRGEGRPARLVLQEIAAKAGLDLK